MRLIPGYPDPYAPVTEPVGVFTWNGKDHEVQSVRVKRSLETGLPAQVAGTDGMVEATAEVVVSTKDMKVTEGVCLPWERPGPKLGDACVVSLGLRDSDGVARVAPRLTGRVDGVVGDASDPTVTLQLVDLVDRFRGGISMDPLHYRHPSPVSAAPPLDMGLHPSYITDRIARASGFYATPRIQSSNAVLSVPLMGSAWPERGTLTYAEVAQAGNPENPLTYPKYASTSWGLAVENLEAIWSPFILSQFTGMLDRPMFVRFLTGPVKAGFSRVYSQWDGSHRIIVSVGIDRGVDVVAADAPGEDADPATGGDRFNMPLTAEEIASGVDVAVWVTPNGSNADIEIGVRVPGGVVRTVTGSIPVSATIRNTVVKEIKLYSPTVSTLIGGLQVGFASAPYPLHNWVRTSVIETDPTGEIRSLWAIVDRQRLDLLQEQAGAELAAMWLDEDGRFRYRSYQRLLSEPATGEPITIHNIDSLGWAENWDSVHSSVGVNYQRPYTSRSTTHRVLATQLSAITMGAGETVEEVIHPEANVDWIDVAPLQLLNAAPESSTIYWFNRGVGSWLAGVVEYEDGAGAKQSFPADYQYLAGSITKMDPRTWVLNANVTPLVTGDYMVTLRTPGWERLWGSKQDQETPLLRAKAVTEWLDEQVTGLPLGLAGADEFSHDAGRWVQREPVAQVLADTLAQFTDQPYPVLDNLTATPDDRRQLADVAPLRFEGVAPDGTPVTWVGRGLVVGIEDRMTRDGRTTTVSVLPIEIEKEAT